MSRGLRAALAATGLLRPAFRVREALRALEHEKPPAKAPDGLPLPSRLQMVRVAGHSDWRRFYDTGLAHAECFIDIAREVGVPFETARSVLDWGCGCGRVSRHVAKRTDAVVHGRDPDPVTIGWAAQALPGDYRISPFNPPLDLADGGVDIAYALSVFTHFGKPLQAAWLAELARVVRPGGLVMLTFMDEVHEKVDALGPARADLDRDGFAVTTGDLEGLNYMATFQTRAQLAAAAAPWFDDVAARTSQQTPMGHAVIALVQR